jgi:hypothetical protein
MSPSDVAGDAAAAVTLLERLGETADLSPDDVSALVSASTRAGRELPPLTQGVSTTEALTLACALLRSQDLTPFDMAMWFSRGGKQD